MSIATHAHFGEPACLTFPVDAQILLFLVLVDLSVSLLVRREEGQSARRDSRGASGGGFDRPGKKDEEKGE
jgi:hypothetical protein